MDRSDSTWFTTKSTSIGSIGLSTNLSMLLIKEKIKVLSCYKKLWHLLWTRRGRKILRTILRERAMLDLWVAVDWKEKDYSKQLEKHQKERLIMSSKNKHFPIRLFYIDWVVDPIRFISTPRQPKMEVLIDPSSTVLNCRLRFSHLWSCM